MATAAQLKAHLAQGGNAKKVNDLKRYVQLTGAAAGNPGAGYEAPETAAESAWGGVKAVGSNTLNALSVPQAALFTGVAKASGKDLSWKNMFGNFRKDAAGRGGGDAALNSLGVTNAMARLGISLVADPLWLVGGGLVKAGKIGEAVAKTSTAKSVAETALKAATDDVNRLARNAARSKDKSKAASFVKQIEKAKQKVAEAEKVVKAERRKKKIEDTPFEDLFKTDEFGNVVNKDEGLVKVRQAMTQANTRKDMNYAVNFGLGRFKKQLDLGISAERSLGGKNFRAGMLAMKPVEKVAHALRRSGAEMSEAVDPNVLQMAAKYGLTHTTAKGGEAINASDATVLGVIRSLRSQNDESGKLLEDFMREKGLWNEGHDNVMREIDSRYETLRKADLPDEERFAEQYAALTKRENKAQRQLKRAQQAHNAAGKTATSDVKTGKALKKAEAELAAVKKERQLLDERGAYTKQGMRRSQLEDKKAQRRKDVLTGREAPGSQYRVYEDAEKAMKEREVLDNPFALLTREQMADDLVEAGLTRTDAEQITDYIDSMLSAKGIRTFRDAEQVKTLPEWNAFTLYASRENDHIWKQVDNQIDELAKQAGIPTGSEVGQALKFAHTGGPLSKSPAGNLALNSIAKFKGFLTFVNPSHWVRNLTGDYMNSMVNGGFRHADPRAMMQVGVTRSANSRLANAQVWAGEGRQDAEILARVHSIGGKEYTGADLLAMSRMVGLGRGYVGTDVAIMTDAFERAAGRPGEFYRFMQRLNIKRENAQRMRTWIKHMENGDDPLIAGVKTLRVHFDYTQLTGFEKLIMRNVLLFYTWMKRNTILQATGVVTRPGLYAGYAHLEEARPKIANEPDYYSHQGAIPIPGFGALVVGAPVGDLWKIEASLEGFRRDVLGAITPPLRVPTELATNTKMFTGGNIQQYAGQKTQFGPAEWLGIGTDTTAKAGGNSSKGINPQLAYLISQVGGPQGATAQALSNPDYEGNKWQEGVQRFIGVSKQPNRKEQFARAAKYLKAKKKADATRAKNAQKGD